jgi:GH18 family chitinase
VPFGFDPYNLNQEFNEGFNVSDAVDRMLSQGVPSQRLVIGAAMYARACSGYNE